MGAPQARGSPRTRVLSLSLHSHPQSWGPGITPALTVLKLENQEVEASHPKILSGGRKFPRSPQKN